MRLITLAFLMFFLGAAPVWATDYVYVSVNGDTLAGSAVSGDTLAFGCNLGGRGVWWEVLVDTDNSGDPSPQDEFLVGLRQVDQDFWFAYGMADGDSAVGWVRADVGPVGIAPGYTYVIVATDEDGSSAHDTLAAFPIPAPAGIISGTVALEGIVPPHASLAMIEVEASRDTAGGFWTAFTDSNGDYTIEVDSSSLGVLHRVGANSVIFGYVNPDSDTMILVDTLYGVDFLYELAAAMVVGSVIDQDGDSLPRGMMMEATSPVPVRKETELYEPGRYFLAFDDLELGDWSVGLSGFGLFPFYLLPPSEDVTLASGDTIAVNFTVYEADTLIEGVVTVADTVPLDTFHFVLAECETAGVGVTYAICDSATGAYGLSVNRGDTLTWRVVLDPPDGNSLPGYVVEDGFARMGINGGESVNFNFVPATDTIGGQVSFDPSVPGSLQFPLDTLSILNVYWTSPLFPFRNVSGYTKPDISGLYQLPSEPDTYALFCTDFPDTNYFAVPMYYDSLVISGGTDTLDFVVFHTSTGTSERDGHRVPIREARLRPCSPNPFRSETVIKAEIPAGSSARGSIAVFDIAGRLVKTLSEGGTGSLRLVWDGTDSSGHLVPGGIYFVRLAFPNGLLTEKAVLLR